jgi:heptaprenylglyceryl phosphate synthase
MESEYRTGNYFAHRWIYMEMGSGNGDSADP